jgi:diguanylate cyclase (GGDEF)-like protein
VGVQAAVRASGSAGVAHESTAGLKGLAMRFSTPAVRRWGTMSAGITNELNQDVDTLLTALEEIDLGVVLLDCHLRVKFVNLAFLRLYRLPDKSVASNCDFEGLMRLVVGRRRVLASAEFNCYIKKRVKEVRAGIEASRDIRMDDGQVIRVHCKTLPTGGRMLVYADVTDLMQYADKLKVLATVDGMTGLFNRRHFLSLAEIEWSRYQRYWRPMSLALFDIDRFKSINDSFGHCAGDHVIIQIADICQQQKRKPDIIARFGGEEFLILLPETELAAAQRVAERLRRKVETSAFSVASNAISTTISVGVAEADPSMNSIFDLIKLADKALYTAKESGRNRVCAA